MTSLPRVGLIMTGGTIDSVGADRLDLAFYTETGQRLREGELVGRLPELSRIAAVRAHPFRRLPSHALSDRDWLDLARQIEALLGGGEADGIVVTHGTNTLEETAFFLNLALRTDRPVVVVGAMRPALALGADGYLNLLNAVRVAGDAGSCGLGCLVVMNDAIYSARDVTKTSTFRVDAFRSRDLGPLGFADADGRIVYYHRPLRRHTAGTEFDVGALPALPRVDIVLSYVGADGVMIEAAARAGARAIVAAGTGAGRPTPAEDAALERVSREHGVLICLCSRVGSGRVARSPRLAGLGVVAADNLPPWKARILMALALTRTADAAEIQRLFDTC